jgi:hypothetical protein
MYSCNKDYSTAMPDVTVYVNCDTCLAINLSFFRLGEYDELIFNIKNYSYMDSSSVFLFRATLADMNDNGEVLFNIDPDVSKNIKPGAFYNFALLRNANNPHELTEYKKLTENGKILLEYGAHDLALSSIPEMPSPFSEILSARIEATDDASHNCAANGTLVDLRFEADDEPVCQRR